MKKRKPAEKSKPKARRQRPPSTNGGNGRGNSGRFLPGNPGGPGNPFARQTAELRSVLLGTVTAEDIQAVVEQLITMARGGNLAAIRELFDRVFGKANQPVEAQVTQSFDGMEEQELVLLAVGELLENDDRRTLLLAELESKGYRVQQAKRGKRKP